MKNEYIEQLQKLSDEKLVERFNSDVGNPGWVAARGRFLEAMREEFIRRDFDTSEIIMDGGMSMKYKVRLVIKKKLSKIKE